MASPAVKMMTGPAKVVTAPPIEATSLMCVLESILEVPMGSHTVKVRSLVVQHAAVEMLCFQTSCCHWEIQDLRKLKIFVSVDAVLSSSMTCYCRSLASIHLSSHRRPLQAEDCER